MSSLAGKQVVVTRAASQAEELVEQLTAKKAEPMKLPLIAFEDPADWKPIDRALDDLSQYDLLLLTSRQAVARFLARWQDKPRTWQPGKPKIAAVGLKTASDLEKANILVDIVPPKAHAAEELAEALLQNMCLDRQRVLFLRAAEGRDVLVNSLQKAGARVELLALYHTVPCQESLQEIQTWIQTGRRVDWFTFASSSAVRFLAEAIGEKRLASWVRKQSIGLAAIGRVTQATLQEYDLEATVVASIPSHESLLEAMEAYEREDQHA